MGGLISLSFVLFFFAASWQFGVSFGIGWDFIRIITQLANRSFVRINIAAVLEGNGENLRF